MRKYTNLIQKSIKTDFPKSFNHLIQWIDEIVLEKKEETKNANRITIAENILMYSPRVLYDFFDDNDIFISIVAVPSSDQFTWSINDSESFAAEDRIDAEIAGLIAAFQQLENKLGI